MCRYAFSGPYKQHYACFQCRKVFRERYARANVYQPPAGVEIVPHRPSCPQCGRLMSKMGLDFKTPKQNDIRQWQKVEILFSHGIAFHSCGCGPGYRPATLSEIPAFLRERQQMQATNANQRRLQKKRDQKAAKARAR